MPDPSTDPVGTVRREEHEDGYSIWQRVGTCRSVWDKTDSRYVSEPSSVWRCVHSTSAGNLGAHLMDYQISGEWAAIGAVPGTPADQRGDETVVVLCGSMRFWPHMLHVAERETAAGSIVLAPFCAVVPEDQGGEFKAMLDELHRAKIRMAHQVIVVSDKSGYYGKSTSREIRYAGELGLPVEHRCVELPAAPGRCLSCGSEGRETVTNEVDRRDAYVRLTHETVAKTRQLFDNVLVDLDKKNGIVGVEILAPQEVTVDGRLVAAPAADRTAERDAVRDRIAHAMCETTGHFGDVLDGVMAVVDPVVLSRDAYRDERDQTQRERDLLAWLHAEAVWQLNEVHVDRQELKREAAHLSSMLRGMARRSNAYRRAGRRNFDKLMVKWLRAEDALESARRQMQRFEVQRDEWKAVLGVEPGDIDTTPEEAVARNVAEERESRFRWAEEAAECERRAQRERFCAGMLRDAIVRELHVLADRDELCTRDIHTLADHIEAGDWLDGDPGLGPTHPTLAETRTGMDWCPNCGEKAGTNRYRDDAEVERCATCGSELAEREEPADVQ